MAIPNMRASVFPVIVVGTFLSQQVMV